MRQFFLSQALKILLAVLTPELIAGMLHKMIQYLEDYVLGTKSTVDDQLVLPVCEMFKKIIKSYESGE